MRPYQGQVTIPPFALAQVTKLVGGNLELQRVENGTTLGELDSAQEFGGTLTYPAGTLTMEHPDPSGWTGENWLGTRDYTYPAGTHDWAATANETWISPLLPARAEVTVTETAPETTAAGDWSVDTPGTFTIGEAQLPELAGLAGTDKTATNIANTVTTQCLKTEDFEARTEKLQTSSVSQNNSVTNVYVANNLSIPECPETPVPPTPPAPPAEEPPAPPLNPPAATPPTPAKPGLATTGAAVTTIAIIAVVAVLAGAGIALAKRKDNSDNQ
ncbi:MAG: hypothetical protein SPG61_04315, partial [Arcanobacterium sp.]|nr:hypothetical protein [Arcanobacterium sp.]